MNFDYFKEHYKNHKLEYIFSMSLIFILLVLVFNMNSNYYKKEDCNSNLALSIINDSLNSEHDTLKMLSKKNDTFTISLKDVKEGFGGEGSGVRECIGLLVLHDDESKDISTILRFSIGLADDSSFFDRKIFVRIKNLYD